MKKVPANRQLQRMLLPRGAVQGFGGAFATVQHGVGAEITISLEPRSLGRANRVFSADRARAVSREGAPELQFIQLHPTEKRVTRLVCVRYELDRFLERAKVNDTFRLETLKAGAPKLRAANERDLFDGPVADAATALIDVEFDMIARVGQRMSFSFFTANAAELHAAITSRAGGFGLSQELDVHIPLGAGLELIVGWLELAQSLAS